MPTVAATNPTSTAESDTDTTLTFTAGTDDITSVVFRDPGPTGITVVNDDAGPTAVAMTWALSGGDLTLTGSIGMDEVIVLRITDPTPITAGQNADVTVTVSLLDAFPHATFTAEDVISITGITVRAADGDGQFADGTVSVTVTDDVPVINSITGGVLIAEPGAMLDGVYDADIGADGLKLLALALGTARLVFSRP